MDLKANTAVDVLIGPFVDDTDGKTAETGLTLAQADIKLSKNGQALTQKNDATAATHDASGYYNCELDATDTNTEGTLVLICSKSGALPVRHEFNVLAEAAYDSLFAAKDTGYMDVNIKAISDDTASADNLELDYDGTGYTKSNSTIGTCTANSDMRGTDSAALASVCTEERLAELAAANLPTDIDALLSRLTSARAGYLDKLNVTGTIAHSDDAATYKADVSALATSAALATVDSIVDAIKAVTDNIPDSGALTGLTAYVDTLETTLENASYGLAALKTLIDTIDNFVDTEVAAIKAVTDKLDDTLEDDAGTYRFTVNALENAPSGTGASAEAIRQEIDANSTQLAAIVADTNELQTNQGNWATATGFATDANLATVDTVVDAIKAKTDNLPASPAATSDIPTAVQNRAEMDLNSTQLAAIVADTNELQTNQDNWLTATGFATEGDLTPIGTAVDGIQTDLSNGTDGLGALKSLLDAIAGYIDTEVAAIKAKTDNLPADPASETNVNANGAKIDAIDTVVDAIKAVTDKIDDTLADDGGTYQFTINALENAPSGSGVSAESIRQEIDANSTRLSSIETDTQDIQSRIPAALVGGRILADAVAISGSADAADKLEASAETIVTGAAQSGTLSTTQMSTDLTETTDDHYNGRIIIWKSGVLKDQATNITDYDGTSKMLTFTATTEAPGDGDAFVIV